MLFCFRASVLHVNELIALTLICPCLLRWCVGSLYCIASCYALIVFTTRSVLRWNVELLVLTEVLKG